MKVLIISGSYPPIKCGIGDYVQNLESGLINQGLDVVVLTSTITTKSLSKSIRPIINKWSWSSLKLILNTVKVENPGVIHFQYSSVRYPRRLFVNLIPLLLKMSFVKIPVVVTIHEYRSASLLGKFRVIIMILFASKIIVSNEVDYNKLKIFNRSIQIVPIGSNIPIIDNKKTVKSLSETDTTPLTIGYFGTISPSKGVDKLIEAFIVLLKNYDLHLLILGELNNSDGYHRKIKELIKGHEADIIVSGYLPAIEVSKKIVSINLMVLPFDKPATPHRGSLLASVLNGVPTLTTGQNTWPLEDKINVYFVKDSSPDNLIRKITLILDNPQSMYKVGQNAKKLKSTFSWENIAKLHNKIYLNIVGVKS